MANQVSGVGGQSNNVNELHSLSRTERNILIGTIGMGGDVLETSEADPKLRALLGKLQAGRPDLAAPSNNSMDENSANLDKLLIGVHQLMVDDADNQVALGTSTIERTTEMRKMDREAAQVEYEKSMDDAREAAQAAEKGGFLGDILKPAMPIPLVGAVASGVAKVGRGFGEMERAEFQQKSDKHRAQYHRMEAQIDNVDKKREDEGQNMLEGAGKHREKVLESMQKVLKEVQDARAQVASNMTSNI